VVPAVVVSQFKVKGTINIKVKGDGQECPSHTSQWWKCLADDGVQG
jgi:hypothetical protein